MVWFRNLLLIYLLEIMGVADVIKKQTNSFVLVAADAGFFFFFFKLNFTSGHCVVFDISAVQF